MNRYTQDSSKRAAVRFVSGTALAIVVLATLGAMGATGCVIPPQLDPEGSSDGGVNAFPSLIEIDPNFPTPGPIDITSQDQREMSFRVRDADLDDTIYIYLFRDYNYPDPTPHLSTCQDSTNELERNLTCRLNRLCGFIDGTDTIHVLEAMVTDRELTGEEEPLFRALPEGAGFSFRTWLMTCSTDPLP